MLEVYYLSRHSFNAHTCIVQTCHEEPSPENCLLGAIHLLLALSEGGGLGRPNGRKSTFTLLLFIHMEDAFYSSLSRRRPWWAPRP